MLMDFSAWNFYLGKDGSVSGGNDKKNQFSFVYLLFSICFFTGYPKKYEDVMVAESPVIKSLDARDKGNTSEANVLMWPASAEKVRQEYPDAEVVIPGHGKWGNVDLIRHTIELVRK